LKISNKTASSKEDEDERQRAKAREQERLINRLTSRTPDVPSKGNLPNYPSPCYTVSEKENGLQHIRLGPHEFIKSGCEGEVWGNLYIFILNTHINIPLYIHTSKQKLRVGVVQHFSFYPDLESCHLGYLLICFLDENNCLLKEFY
jgi:hypothetical protein